jgi:hypothetical protein
MQHATFKISANEKGIAAPACAKPSPSLLFVEQLGRADGWIAACSDLLAAGKPKISIRVLDGAFSPIGEQLIARFGDRLVILDRRNGGRSNESTCTETSAVLLLGGDADAVSAALMDYVDDMAATIVAPVTERYWNRLPLYLISIPKAGTHLLFQLVEALGYQPGGPSPENPTGGCWYYVLNTNAHTGADEFCLEATQKAPFGNRAHPFLRAPVRDQLGALSDAMPALVRNELQKLLAGKPNALVALVHDELAGMSDTMRLVVRDELQMLLPTKPEAPPPVACDELQNLPVLDRNEAVKSRGGFLGYNLFQRRYDTIALPRRLGPVDPADASLREWPGVIAARSANAARLAVVWRWVRWAYWDGARS